MADTGWLTGTATVEDTSTGATQWAFGDYSPILAEDASTAGYDGSGTGTIEVQIVIGGSRVGTPKSIVSVPGSLSFATTLGGPTDKWGVTTPTQGQVVASNFGVGVQPVFNDDLYFALAETYGASVAGGATIDGFEVRVKCVRTEIEPGYNETHIDSVQVKIYYTEGGGGGSTGAGRISLLTMGCG